MKKCESIFMTILFFGCTLNSLFRFPLEKVIIVLTILLFFGSYQKIPKNSFLALLIIFAGLLLTYLVNLIHFSFLLFFPIVGIFFIILVAKNPKNIYYLYWGLGFHILLGLLYVIHSYVFGLAHITRFVRPMFDKGLPFLHAAMGFTPTVQSFGTMCLGWLLIYFFKKENNDLKWIDKVMFFITILSVIVTFNRNTFVLFIFITMIHYRIFFIVFITTVIVGIVYYFGFIKSLVLNVNTMDSRRLGLEGFNLSFITRLLIKPK